MTQMYDLDDPEPRVDDLDRKLHGEFDAELWNQLLRRLNSVTVLFESLISAFLIILFLLISHLNVVALVLLPAPLLTLICAVLVHIALKRYRPAFLLLYAMWKGALMIGIVPPLISSTMRLDELSAGRRWYRDRLLLPVVLALWVYMVISLFSLCVALIYAHKLHIWRRRLLMEQDFWLGEPNDYQVTILAQSKVSGVRL